MCAAIGEIGLILQALEMTQEAIGISILKSKLKTTTKNAHSETCG
jgi:hypothetical protein